MELYATIIVVLIYIVVPYLKLLSLFNLSHLISSIKTISFTVCVSPLKIRNPYLTSRPFVYSEGAVKQCDPRFVSAEPYITVPCGKCADCRASYYESIRQRAIAESLTSYVYFVTLTYDNEHLPKIQFTSNKGLIDIYYSDISHIQLLFKRVRDLPYLSEREFRYLGVTEYGTAKCRPHHHLILFVARKPGDTDQTPQDLETLLYEDIKRLYAINVGTRKHPVYEPLFNHRTKLVDGKIHTNYSCSLVVSKDQEGNRTSVVNTPESISKCISYLISYVNKSSRYEQYISEFLTDLKLQLDPALLNKISRLLKTRVYYSKHFGFGFDNKGLKVTPSVKHMIVTESMLSLSEHMSNLPADFQDFKRYYPSAYVRYRDFKTKLETKLYFGDISSYKDMFTDLFTGDDYLNLCIASKYEPDWSRIVWYNLTNLSEFCYRSLPKRDFDRTYQQSVTYNFIRKSVEDGITMKLPYLAFNDSMSGVPVYKPLCRYFRRYCTDLNDLFKVFQVLKVSNYDQYVHQFEFSPDSYHRKLLKQSVNDKKETSFQSLVPLPGTNNAIYLHHKKKLIIFAPASSFFEAF